MIRTTAVFIAFIFAGSVETSAQSCTPKEQPYFEFQVATRAEFLKSDSALVRPARDERAMRREKTDTFLVQFVVDSIGKPMPRSLKFLKGGSDADRAAVRTALPTWIYTPARMSADCPVMQLVQTPIQR